MAVSYLSRPIETTPYVNPLDLNLLAKVNSYKQSMFYQNAQKVSDTLGQISNADIINPVQKEYLNSAVNSVTKKINDYGAMDYSDMGVANSVQNLGTEIYKDANIMNGIASTKKVRQIQENYQKMANDPKLNKFYSTAYEAYDYEHYIKPYINSDNIKASYDGPINPTIYTGNPLEKAAKLIKQAHPEIVSEVVNDRATGGYINIKTSERYTPEQLSSVFDSLIDGQTKTELVKNAWYTLDYSNRKQDGTPVYDENGYVKMLHDQEGTQIVNLEAELKATKEAIIVSGLDTDVAKSAQQHADRLTKQISALKEASSNNELAFRNTFKKDKDSALYQLYVNGIKHDLYNVFGAEQTKIALKADLNQVYENQKELAYIRKGLQYNGLNPDGTPNLTPIKGADGKPVNTPISDFTALQSDLSTDEELKGKQVTIESIASHNQEINNEISSKFTDYIRNQAEADRKNGAGNLAEVLGFEKSTTTDAGSANIVSSSKILNRVRNINKETGSDVLDINDLRAVTTNLNTAVRYGLNRKAFDYLQSLVSSYDKITKDVDYDKPIPQEFKTFVDQYEDKMQLINSNKNLLDKTKQKVFEENTISLTKDEKSKLLDFYNNPSKYISSVKGLINDIPDYLGTATKPKNLNKTGITAKEVPLINNEIKAILAKTKLKNTSSLSEEINKKLANTATRDNYLSIYLDNANNEQGLKQLVPGLNPYIFGENKDVLGDQKVTADNVHPLSIYYSPDGWKVKYTINIDGKTFFSDKNGTNKLKDLPLTEVQAKTLGAQSIPYPEFEKVADLEGEAEKKYIVPTFYNVKSDGTVAKNASPVQIRVFTSDNTRNNRFFKPQVWSPTLNRYETIPYEPGDEKYGVSANGAYMYATKLLDSYAQTNRNDIGKKVTNSDGTTSIIKNIDTFIENYITPRQKAGY